jgi:hypothetical protein
VANEACDRDYPARDAFRAALGVKPPPHAPSQPCHGQLIGVPQASDQRDATFTCEGNFGGFTLSSKGSDRIAQILTAPAGFVCQQGIHLELFRCTGPLASGQPVSGLRVRFDAAPTVTTEGPCIYLWPTDTAGMTKSMVSTVCEPVAPTARAARALPT